MDEDQQQPIKQTKIAQFDIEEKPMAQPFRRKEIPATKPPLGQHLLILFTEIIGTAIFAYGIVASGGQDSIISISLFAGIIISYKFSGGHVKKSLDLHVSNIQLNPAVTFGFYCDNTIRMSTLRYYCLGQAGGVIVGGLLAFIILGEKLAPQIRSSTFEWIIADMLSEAFGTFLFILFIQIQVHKETSFTDNDIAGVGVIAGALLLGRSFTPHTGGCLNPAIGPGLQLVKAFIENDPAQLNNFWVFMVGPFFGGYLAQLFYWDIYVPFAYKQPEE